MIPNDIFNIPMKHSRSEDEALRCDADYGSINGSISWWRRGSFAAQNFDRDYIGGLDLIIPRRGALYGCVVRASTIRTCVVTPLIITRHF